MIHFAPAKPRALRKLVEFANLPAGWHYGRGGPIARDTLAAAEDVVHLFMMYGLHRTDAFPGLEGDVQVSAYHGEHAIAVTLEADGRIGFLHELGAAECCEGEGLSMRELREELRKVAGEIWPLSDSFIHASSSMSGADSVTSPSRNLPRTMVFPLWMRTAPRPLVAA